MQTGTHIMQATADLAGHHGIFGDQYGARFARQRGRQKCVHMDLLSGKNSRLQCRVAMHYQRAYAQTVCR